MRPGAAGPSPWGRRVPASAPEPTGGTAGDASLKAFMRLQPLFADLSDEDLERLIGHGHADQLVSDDPILRGGGGRQRANDMFIILEG